MTLAQGGETRHRTGRHLRWHELPKGINKFTAASAKGAGRPGIAGRGPRYHAARRPDAFLCGGLCRSGSGSRNRQVPHLGLPGRGDVGTVIHPARAGRADAGPFHARHRPRDRPEVGLRSALRPSGCQAVPPHQAADHSGRAGTTWQWAAVDIPDPETPVGARGIGEPPVGAGAWRFSTRFRMRLGDDVFRRAPVLADTILASLEAGRPEGLMEFKRASRPT
jgi:hypothetical protein